MDRHRVVVASVLSLLLFALGCSARKSEQYRRDGDTLFHLGKFDEAEGAYRRAEEVDPNNAQAKVGQGRCYVVKQRYEDALDQFQGALKIAPNLDAACTDAVRVLMKLGRPDEALAMAQQYETANPLRGGVISAHVLCETGRAAEAVERLSKLREQFPDSTSLQVSLAAAHLAAGGPADAETELRALLANPDRESGVAARLLLIDACEAQGKASEMASELERLSNERPDDMGMKLALTYALLKVGRVEDAEAKAREMYQEQPNSGWANHLLGSCLLARKQYAEAVPYLEKAAAALPLFTQTTRNLALALAGGAAPEQATPAPAGPATSQIAPAPPPPEEGLADWRALWKRADLGSLLANRAEFLSQGDPEAAETLALGAFIKGDKALTQELTAALPANSPLQGYFRAVESRNSEQFFQHMKQWTETDPARSVLRANAYAAGLALMGARFQAVHVLSMSFDSAPDYGITLYNLAQVLRASGNPLLAARVLGRLVPLAVSNVDIHGLLYTLFREGGALDEAQKSAEITYSLFPNRPDVCLNLAQAYLDTGRLDVAEKVLRRAAESHPDAARLQIGLGRLLLHSGKPDEAYALLSSLQAPPENQRELKASIVFCLGRLNDWDRVLEATTPVQGEDLGGPLRLIRAAALLNKGKPNEAKTLLRTPAETEKADTNRQILFAALGEPALLEAGEAKALATSLAGNLPALTHYVYALACLDIPSYRLALASLQDAYDLLGGDPVIAGLMLRCMTRALPEEVRVQQARALAERHASSGSVWVGLAEALASLKDVQGEGEALAKAVELGPDLPEAWLKRAFFFEQQGDWPAAAEAYRRLMKLTPDDGIANNNLAYSILMTKGNVDEALQLAQAAVEKLPNAPEALHTLGLAQFRKGDLEQGRKNLLLALALRPAEPTLLLDYGQLLIAQGRKEEGRSYIQLAVRFSDQVGLSFPRRAEAEKTLATE